MQKTAIFEKPLPKPQKRDILSAGRRLSGGRVPVHSAGLLCSNTADRLFCLCHYVSMKGIKSQ